MNCKPRDTKYSKGHRGHEAQTGHELPNLCMSVLAHKEPGLPVLKISTYKAERRGLLSLASVAREVKHEGYTSEVFAIGMAVPGRGDYMQRLITTPGKRAAEKSIAEQHARAMAMLPAILVAVAEHYAACIVRERAEYPTQCVPAADVSEPGHPENPRADYSVPV